jgi:chromosome segregation ATPase
MLAPDKLQEKMASLSSRHARVLRRKAELGGELKSKKDELTSLVKEIQDAGYNPKTLVEDRDNAQRELETLIEKFEEELVAAETILEDYDNK